MNGRSIAEPGTLDHAKEVVDALREADLEPAGVEFIRTGPNGRCSEFVVVFSADEDSPEIMADGGTTADVLVCRECGYEHASGEWDSLPVIQDEDSERYGKVVCPECDGDRWDRESSDETAEDR